MQCFYVAVIYMFFGHMFRCLMFELHCKRTRLLLARNYGAGFRGITRWWVWVVMGVKATPQVPLWVKEMRAILSQEQLRVPLVGCSLQELGLTEHDQGDLWLRTRGLLKRHL